MRIHFEENRGQQLRKIILSSLAFHAALLGVLLALWVFQPKAEVHKVHVFEMVQLPQPEIAPKQQAPEPTPETPVQKQPEPIPPKPKAELKPEVKPEPKPDKKPEKKLEKKPEPEKQQEVKKDTLKNTQLALPSFNAPKPPIDLPPAPQAASPISTVNKVNVDPLMKAYFQRIITTLMRNFQAPVVDLPKNAKSRVKFTIQKNGKITGISLQGSAGDATWDRLAVRAVSVSRLPPLPPTYGEGSLPLYFDFRIMR
jgi:TonB family protein